VLVASEKQTGCAYKGFASYRSLRAGGAQEDDVVWFYPEPLRDGEQRDGREHLEHRERVRAVEERGNVDLERPRLHVLVRERVQRPAGAREQGEIADVAAAVGPREQRREQRDDHPGGDTRHGT
jgi:hypothetical protein